MTPWRGYGQYNKTAGFHWALDFHGSEGEIVDAPSSNPCDNWLLEASSAADTSIEVSIEGQALIGGGRFASRGWHYAHINITHPKFPFNPTNPPGPLGRAFVAPLTPHALGSHVHFAWLGRDSYQPPFEQPGLFNPFESLPTSEYPFDVASFGLVSIEGEIANSSGILFVNDNTNLPLVVQSRLQDVVDIIIHAYTSYITDTANDKCGVSVVTWRLLKQDCSTLEYTKYAVLGNWRTLFNFRIDEDIPYPSSPEDEYYKVYFPDQYHWENAVVLTNTCDSPREDAPFEGVKTVWIDSYDPVDDFNDGEFCRGAWDTRLCISDSVNPAYTDEAASFPDGRYAVEVMAIPQKSPDSTFRTLPVNNITLLRPEITGVIVDNWAPRITDICFRDNPTETVFNDYYTIIEENYPDSGRWMQSVSAPGWNYINASGDLNEYSLEISYSEPVTVIQSIPVIIKMFTGPDSSVNWERELDLTLDASCLNSLGECQTAIYRTSESGPSGYVGNQLVELEIHSNFATDLAGKPLDADASTVATAWGEGGSNCETTYSHLVPHQTLAGYYREPGDQDSRSNILYAVYDIRTSPFEFIEHYITLTGPLTTADLFHEVNLFSGPDHTRCDIYGGTWMCDWVGEILHVYIVDYLGSIKLDEIVCDFSAIPAYGYLYDAVATNLTYPSGNPYHESTRDSDRFGWLAWRKKTPPPEDGISTRDDDVYAIELNVTVYDAFDGSKIDSLLCTAEQWEDEGTWYTSNFLSITPAYPSDDGKLEVMTCEYQYPDTTPEYKTYLLDPPGSSDRISNTIYQDNLSSTELSSRGTYIEDYFTVFPNPVRSSLSISFMTSEDSGSTVHVYDISGHLLNTIAEELPGMQNHNLLWNLKDANGYIVPTGIYYVSLVSGSLTEETRTVIVIH